MDSYFVIIFKSKTGGFVSEFPDFIEGFTQGDTLEECIDMSQDVLNICAEEYTRERRSIPVPSSLEIIRQKAQELFDNDTSGDFDKSVLPFIQLMKIPNMDSKPVKVTVSIPKNVLELVDKKADSLGMTRSGFLANAAIGFEV